MPIDSIYKLSEIPSVDLWDFMFNNAKREAFPDDQGKYKLRAIYRSLDSTLSYTYRQVEHGAVRFGQYLRSQWNWQKGDVLCVVAPNDIDFAPMVFGVFFAGGIVCPANPIYTAEELTYMLKDSGAKAVVTVEAAAPVVQAAASLSGIPSERVLLMGQHRSPKNDLLHWKALRTPQRQMADAACSRAIHDPDQDLAFLVYSSGTTGFPKGVMLSHRNVISDILMITDSVGKNYTWKQDVLLGVLPFYHIYGLTGIVLQTLFRGIELIVMPQFDLEQFCRAIEQHRITFVYVAPPVLVRLSRDPIVSKFDLSSLRMITSGAAPLTHELVTAVHRRLGVRINQAYGLSETSPMTHTQPWEEWDKSVGSIGKLFPGMKASIVSELGTELGMHQPGEMWLKGPNVFKGYWRNQAATENAFTQDGWFKTGDVAVLDGDNNFYVTDRIKELIKYNGFQVAPAELEGVLLNHPKVLDAAVMGVEDRENQTEVPRAYVVLATGVEPAEVTAREIMKWSDSLLAPYKRLRGGISFTSQIPKSAAGKILRRLLKERVKEGSDFAFPYKQALVAKL